jgi:uridine kinase
MTETRKELLNTLIYQINLSRQNHKIPFKVAIDGVDGAGKTFLARELYNLMLKDKYPAILTSLDFFHKNKKSTLTLNNKSPEEYYNNFFDYDKLLEYLIIPAMKSDDIEIKTAFNNPKNNCKINQKPQKIASDTILIFDGVFLNRPRLQKFWDLHIFIHTDFDNILKRIQDPSTSEVTDQDNIKELYLKKYIPAQILYLKECHPHLQADILINNNNYDHPFFMVNTREKELFLQHAISFFDYSKEENLNF